MGNHDNGIGHRIPSSSSANSASVSMRVRAPSSIMRNWGNLEVGFDTALLRVTSRLMTPIGECAPSGAAGVCVLKPAGVRILPITNSGSASDRSYRAGGSIGAVRYFAGSSHRYMASCDAGRAPSYHFWSSGAFHVTAAVNMVEVRNEENQRP